jgi:hypothetical protein
MIYMLSHAWPVQHLTSTSEYVWRGCARRDRIILACLQAEMIVFGSSGVHVAKVIDLAYLWRPASVRSAGAQRSVHVEREREELESSLPVRQAAQ